MYLTIATATNATKATIILDNVMFLKIVTIKSQTFEELALCAGKLSYA
jgi:hypothetical protein